MRVDQLYKHVLFDDSSSKLRMCKTSATGMLFEVFLCQIQQFKRMTIISNAIKHYQFSSFLRTYLLGKPPIRYPKTVQKVSRDPGTSCKRTRGGNRITPNSIAACARKQGVIGQFDCENWAFKHLRTLKTNQNMLQNTKASDLTHSGATHHA